MRHLALLMMLAALGTAGEPHTFEYDADPPEPPEPPPLPEPPRLDPISDTAALEKLRSRIRRSDATLPIRCRSAGEIACERFGINAHEQRPRMLVCPQCGSLSLEKYCADVGHHKRRLRIRG